MVWPWQHAGRKIGSSSVFSNRSAMRSCESRGRYNWSGERSMKGRECGWTWTSAASGNARPAAAKLVRRGRSSCELCGCTKEGVAMRLVELPRPKPTVRIPEPPSGPGHSRAGRFSDRHSGQPSAAADAGKPPRSNAEPSDNERELPQRSRTFRQRSRKHEHGRISVKGLGSVQGPRSNVQGRRCRLPPAWTF